MTLNELLARLDGWRDDFKRLERKGARAFAAWRDCHVTARDLLDETRHHLQALVEVFGLDPELWFAIATTLNCAEANALARLLALEVEAPEFAAEFLRTHADGDRSDDDHHGERYHVGTCEVRRGEMVRLLHTTDPFTALPAGAQGTVLSVDDTGTVHVAWNDGSTLGLCPNAGDAFVVVT